MHKNLKKLIVVISLLVVGGCMNRLANEESLNQEITGESVNTIQNTIKRVIDGDTYELYNEDTIRVLGIDYPDISGEVYGKSRIQKWLDMGLTEEKIKRCYSEGQEKLEKMLLNKQVSLVKDENEQDKDKYGRLLRYVELNGLDIEKYLIENGYAIMYDPTKPLCNRCYDYSNLELEIRKNKIGCLWN